VVGNGDKAGDTAGLTGLLSSRNRVGNDDDVITEGVTVILPVLVPFLAAIAIASAVVAVTLVTVIAPTPLVPPVISIGRGRYD
jgi:hypothetical protein